MDDERVAVGFVTCFYLGGSCSFEILDHLDYPRCVWDCNDPGEVDTYCVLSNASVGDVPVPAGDCEFTSVHGTSWGAIKSLYR
jgi:hypothetical protein